MTSHSATFKVIWLSWQLTAWLFLHLHPSLRGSRSWTPAALKWFSSRADISMLTGGWFSCSWRLNAARFPAPGWRRSASLPDYHHFPPCDAHFLF